NGEMMLANKQLPNAVNELESALGCEDTPLDRLVPLLRKAVEADAKHGYARYVLAATLLRQGQDIDEAVVSLTAAVQQDDLLIDLASELLAEHATLLEGNASARVLEGLLFLRRGDRDQGIAMLDRALELKPELAAQVGIPLESEWDRDPGPAVGLAFVRALRACGQGRRACRLASELARRFPDGHDRLVVELEALLAAEPSVEAHRTLWEILGTTGQTDGAARHLLAAVEMVKSDPAACRELLESGLRRQPGLPWLATRLAELEARGGNRRRAEELLRGVFAQDLRNSDVVLEALGTDVFASHTPALELLEVDCLLAARRDAEAFERLRPLRIEEKIVPQLLV